MTTTKPRRAIARVLPHKPLSIGVFLLVVMLVAGAALFNKNKIMTTVRSGDTIKVHFASRPVLTPYLSKAKIAFVPVGIVTGVERQGDGTAEVSIKLDKGIRKKLGSHPSAVVRPTTLLGGNYFVDLVPGGEHVAFHGTIPLKRTTLPVELDKVARALSPEALKSTQRTTALLDKTLESGAGTALDELAADAPVALVPAAKVFRSLQGENRYTDLTKLVSALENTSRVLNAKDGQLDSIVSELTRTTGVLSNRAVDVSNAVSQLPGTLRNFDAGLRDLDTALVKLRDTADPLAPTAAELNTTLRHVNPVLVKALPVVKQLDSVLVDLDPTMRDLSPISKGYTGVLKDLQGPVLDRLNGPVKKMLLSPYHGTGLYKNTGSDKPFYQEVAYMLATVDRASAMADRNGNVISFMPGEGPGSVGGLPISLEQMFTILTNQLGITPRKGGK